MQQATNDVSQMGTEELVEDELQVGTNGEGSSRPPPSSAVLDGRKELFCELSRVGAGKGSTLAAIRQVFGEAGHTTKTT